MLSVIVVDYKSMLKTIEYIKHLITKVSDCDKLNFIIIDNSGGEDNFNKLNCFQKIRRNFLNLDLLLKKIDIYNCISKISVYEYKNLKILAIKSENNLGYAKGNNIGAMASKEIFKDDYYIFSNNDLLIKNQIKIEEMIQIFKTDKNIAVVGPKIIGIDGQSQTPRKKLSIYKQLIFHYINKGISARLNKFISDIDYDNKSKYTYWVSGCFYIIDSDKFHQVGMFDHNTFLYAEEMILSERLLKKNYKVFYYNNIEIIHEHGVTTKNIFNELKSDELLFNSNLYYFNKYRKSNRVNILISKLSFSIYKNLYPIKNKIKNKIKN